MSRYVKLALAAGLAVAFLPLSGHGQSYPTKPIRMVTGDPAGGAGDRLFRAINERLAPRLGQPIIVENRPGADGMIALENCARSAGDGYTLCGVTIAFMSIVPNLKKVPVEPLSDLTPITPLVRVAGVVYVNPAVPVKNLKDLVAATRSKPASLNYASFGNGSAPHILFEWLKRQTGADLLHVPYQGGPPALMSVIAGTSNVGYFALAVALPQIKAGKLRPLAVHSIGRSPLLPDVPTMNEQGIDYDLISWFGMVAPRGTPEAIRNRLAADLGSIVNDPGFRKELDNNGYQPFTSTPAEFGEFLRADRQRVAKLLAVAQIKAD